MANIDQLALLLAGGPSAESLAAENPYSYFQKVPDQIGALTEQLAVQAPGRFSTRDLMISALASGLGSGFLGDLSKGYDTTLTDRYKNAVTAFASGRPITEEVSQLPPGLYGDSKKAGDLFAAADRINLTDLFRTSALQQAQEDYRTDKALKTKLVEGMLDENPYTADKAKKMFNQLYGAKGATDPVTAEDTATMLPEISQPDEAAPTKPNVPLEDRGMEGAILDDMSAEIQRQMQQNPGISYNQASTNARTAFKEKREALGRQYKSIEEAGAKGQELKVLADQVEMALSGAGYTGPGGELAQAGANYLGGFVSEDQASKAASGQNVASFAKDAIASFGQVFKGPMSDRDVQIMLRGMPSLSNRPEANAEILKRWRFASALQDKYAEFMTDQQMRGVSPVIAEKNWREFKKDKPYTILTPQGRQFNPYWEQEISGEAPDQGQQQDEELVVGLGGGGAGAGGAPTMPTRAASVAEMVQQPEVVDNRPSIDQAAGFVGRSLASGVGKTLDFVNAINPFRSDPQNLLNFKQNTAQKAMADLFGAPEESGVVGPVADIARAAVEGSTFPLGGPVANALVSAGAEVGSKALPDTVAGPISGALITAAALAGGKAGAKKLIGAGKAFERGSVGARASDYVKSQKKLGTLEDPEIEELGTRLSKAINEIGDSEGFGLLRDPQRLAARNQEALGVLGERIGTALSAADEAGVKPVVSFGASSSVGKLISGAKAEKEDLVKAFNEFIVKFKNKKAGFGWDGTVEGLNAWKSSIGKLAFSGEAAGTLKPAVARKLQRAIYDDLSRSVNNAVVKSGAASADEWSSLMRQYSNHAELMPVLNPELARSLSSTWDKVARAMLRTSGGTLTTPTLIGAAVGTGVGGPLIGLALGGALSAMSSPTGQGILGSLLKTAGRAGSAAIPGGAGTALIPGAIASYDTLFNPSERDLFVAPSQPTQKKNLPMTTEPKATKQDVAAIEAEIDSDPFDAAVYQAESGRNPLAKNPETSASGAFQLIKKTAANLGVKDVFDLKDNYEGFKKLKAENIRALGTDDPKLLYMAHYLGAPVLKKWLAGKTLTDEEEAQVRYLKQKALPDFMKIYNSIVKV